MTGVGLDQAVQALPQQYPGPGGAVAVLREGEVLVRHAWGYANVERRLAFTPRTLFRLCSITKQFTCAALLGAFPDPSALDTDLRALLPALGGAAPNVLHLCHNQSGLRDYWALAMLHGAEAEQPFGPSAAARVILGAPSVQFAPGSRYAYANQNYRLLADLLDARTSDGYADTLGRRILDRAGMAQARIVAQTDSLPDGSEGYEGSQGSGFRRAVNNIVWTGDAGLVATLDDMIAWERFIDATRDDQDAPYSRLARPVTFSDGRPAAYGFGLAARREFGRRVTGHGGALRGWRSHRLYVHDERVSVVVMFNHLSDARAAALDLLSAVLRVERPGPVPMPRPAWLGAYVEPETGLSARLDMAGPGRVRLRFSHLPDILALRPDGTASGDGVRLAPEAGGLRMQRAYENLDTVLQRREGGEASGVEGRYRCAELGTEITVENLGGAVHGAASGFLGQGRMESLAPVAEDLLVLPCWRALDHNPPGEWTLAIQRDAVGRVEALQVGCWLARGLVYRRIA